MRTRSKVNAPLYQDWGNPAVGDHDNKNCRGKAGGKRAVTRATAGPQISQVQYRVLRWSQPQPQRPTRGGGKQAQVLLDSTLCEHGVEDLDHHSSSGRKRARGNGLAQARGYTHRSWRAERRPFLTVLHSSQPPVLGRSDQFRIMCRLLFRRSAVRRGGKVLFSKCKATSCNHHNFAIGSAPYKSGVGVSISGQPKTICRATNCRGCTTCPRAIQTCAHQSSDSRSTVKSILNGPGVTA